MRCRRNQIPGKHSLSLTTKNIYLCGADRIKCRGGKSSVDDEKQLSCAQKKKSNTGKGQGKPVDEQKSEVSAQKLSSQRLQRLFPILHEKGSFYSRTAIRSKQTDYANFQKKKKRVYTI